MEETKEITQEHIIKRVNDWEERINQLYDDIETWLTDDFKINKNYMSVTMNEQMMSKFNIPAKKLPVAQILKNGTPIARLIPYALWIIGANGRIELKINDIYYSIIDESEKLTPPNWKIVSKQSPSERLELNENYFLKILNQG